MVSLIYETVVSILISTASHPSLTEEEEEDGTSTGLVGRIYTVLFTPAKKNKAKKKCTLDDRMYPPSSPTEYPSGIVGVFTYPSPSFADRSPRSKTRKTMHPTASKSHRTVAFVYTVSENSTVAV